MTSIVIRDVPTEVRDVLASRAAASGRSLQQYMLRLVSEAASHRTQAEVLAEIRRRAETFPPITHQQLMDDLSASRGERDDALTSTLTRESTDGQAER